MNQDQIKEQLLMLDGDVLEFTVILSGKQSKRVNGLYKPDSCEIIIHNKNFSDDNEMMYTAIHEFAHHVHMSKSPVPVGPRAHTVEFRNILHELLGKAEELGVFRNVFDTTQEFQDLTQRIREQFMRQNGRLMKEFGAVLGEAAELCRKHNARFEDYVERVLGLNTKDANTVIKFHAFNVNPDLGYENMKTVAGIRNEKERLRAETAFLSGQSPDSVKRSLMTKKQKSDDPLEILRKEKQRIERTISSLQQKLTMVEERLAGVDNREPLANTEDSAE
ncbi:hypothetical protein [Spirochaeta dissipatitropha]